MPSGAKRRKAAKKKKENETHNGNSSKPPQGDEKGSDGGEAGFNSQASEGRRSAEPSDVESVREVGLESDGDVQIERGLKEGARSKKKSDNGKDKSSSSSSSSSSSEDESRRKKEKADALVLEEKPPSNLVDSVDSLLAEVTHTTKDAAVEKSTSIDAEKIAPVEYNEPVVDVSEETVPLTVSTSPFEYPVISDTVAETASESTPEKLLPSEATVTVTDSVSKKSESTESPGASPSVVESEDKENENKVLPSSDVSPAHISNDVESIKQSESPEYSEREFPFLNVMQPLVAPTPRVVENTSWCGCCGILDVITGNRRYIQK